MARPGRIGEGIIRSFMVLGETSGWRYTLICRNRPGKGGVEGDMRPGEGTTDLKSAPNIPVVNTASFLSTVQPGPGHQELYQVCDGGKSC